MAVKLVVQNVSISKRLILYFLLYFLCLSYSTTVFAIAYSIPPDTQTSYTLVSSNSSPPDSLTITPAGTFFPTPATPFAVEFDFDSGNANLTVLNQGLLDYIGTPPDAVFTTATSMGSGSIQITNQENLQITNTTTGQFFNFTNTTVPVLIINEGVNALIAGGSDANLTTGGGVGATLQLGTSSLSGGSIFVPISGDAQSTISVLNNFTFIQLTPVTNVGTISVDTAAGTTLNIGTAGNTASITGFNTFTTTAVSTINVISNGNITVFTWR